MNDFSFSNVLDAAWAFCKKHGLKLSLVFAVVYLITNAIVQSGIDAEAYMNMLDRFAKGGEPDMSVLMNIFRVVCLAKLVELVLLVGVNNNALGIVTGRFKGVTLGAYKISPEVLLKYVAVNIIFYVLIFIGACFYFVPGIYLYLRLQFAPIAVLDKPEIGLGAAFAESWKRTSNHLMPLIGLSLAYCIISVVGLLCLFVGYFFAEAVILAATVYSYLLLDKNHNIEI